MDSKSVNLLKNLSTGLVLLAIVFAFMIAGVRLFGFQVYVVESGSMEPTYPVGSLIYVKSVDPNELRVNDAITYSNSPGVIVTHRIVDIVPDEQYPTIVRYQTKGDANREVDSALVSANNIIGKAIFSLPQLGYLAKYIQQPPGTYVAILVCGLMIAFVFYTDSLETKLKKKEQQQQQPGEEEPKSGMTAWINSLSQKVLGKPLFKEKEPEQPARGQGYVQQPMQYQAQQPYQQYPQQQYAQQQYQQPGQYPNYPQQAPQQQMYQQNPYGAQQQYPQQGFGQSYPQQPQQYAPQGYMQQQPNYQQPQQQNPYAPYPQQPQQARPQQPAQPQQAQPQQYAAPQRYGQQLYMPQNGQQAPQQRNRRADRQ